MNHRERPAADQGAGTYPRVGNAWRWSVYLATTLGLLCAFVEWSWQGLTISAVFVSLCAGAVCASAWSGSGPSAGAQGLRRALTTGVIVTAIAGLLAMFAVIGVVLVLLLTVTSPHVRALARRRRVPRRGRPEVPRPGSEEPPRTRDRSRAASEIRLSAIVDLSTSDDEALCLAWRRSFQLLAEAPSAEAALSIVELRQRYLDELHRRSPQGVAAWFDAGGRASGSPLSFLSDSRRWPGSAAGQ